MPLQVRRLLHRGCDVLGGRGGGCRRGRRRLVDGGRAVEDEPAAGELVQLLEVGAAHEVLIDVAGGVLQLKTRRKCP